MSHVPDQQIDRLIRETGMGRVQAYYSCRRLNHLQEMVRRQRKEAAERCVQLYAERIAKEARSSAA